MCFAMIFQVAPGIFVGGADFLRFVQGIEKFGPVLYPPEGRGGFDKLIQCRGVRLPQPVLLLTGAWHVSIMLQRDAGGQRIMLQSGMRGDRKAPAFRPGLWRTQL
jgi:hypothetical protein